MLEILERLAKAEGEPEDIRTLSDLSTVLSLTSLCGLGQATSIPVLDTLKYFRNDYDARIRQSVLLRSRRVQQSQ